jgi:hypothetical protein
MSDPNYTIQYQNGEEVITVQPTALDASTSIDLFGRSVTDYGNGFWSNLVHLLENFNRTDEPRNAVIGQLWYNGTSLLVCTERPSELLTAVQYEAAITGTSNYRSDAVWSEVVLASNTNDSTPTLESYVKRSYVDSRTRVTSQTPDTTDLSAGVVWYDSVTSVCKILVVDGTNKHWAPLNSITVSNFANPQPVVGEVYLNTSPSTRGLYVCTSYAAGNTPVWTNVTQLDTNVTLTPMIGAKPVSVATNQMFVENSKLKIGLDPSAPVTIATLAASGRLQAVDPVDNLDVANKQYVLQSVIPVKIGNAANAVIGELYYGRPTGYAVDSLVLKTVDGLISFMQSGGSGNLILPTSATSSTVAVTGSIYFNTTDKAIKYFDSVSWLTIASSNGDNNISGNNTFTKQVKLYAPDGTPPFEVTSQTLVPNLNIRTINGVTVQGNAKPGTVLSCIDSTTAEWTPGLTATADNVLTGNNKFTKHLTIITDSDTPPFTVTSNKLVPTLNVGTVNNVTMTGGAVPNYSLRATTTNDATWSPSIWADTANTFNNTNTFTSPITITSSNAPLVVSSTNLIPNLNAELVNYTKVSGAAQAGFVLTGTGVNAATWQLPGSSVLPEVVTTSNAFIVSSATTAMWVVSNNSVSLAHHNRVGAKITVCNSNALRMLITPLEGISAYVPGTGYVSSSVKLPPHGICEITYIGQDSYLLTGSALDASVNHPHMGGLFITGSLFVGSTLTVSNDLTDADGLGTFSYQWLANGVAIAGATSPTYLLTLAEAYKFVAAKVSYYDNSGNFEVATVSTASIIAKVNQAAAGTVTITGKLKPDEYVTANLNITDPNGMPANTIYTYRWYVAGIAVPNNNFNRYAISLSDVGKLISVNVSFLDGDSFAESITGTATRVVSLGNVAGTGTVTITGTAVIGRTLQGVSTLADANELGTLQYQWKANGIAIPDAIAATYVVAESDHGKVITLTISYTDGDGFAESSTSAPTTMVIGENAAPTGTVVVTGGLTVGSTLVANTSELVDANVLGTLSYQWKADNVNIVNATNATYQVTQANAGKLITVAINYTDGDGYPESLTATAGTISTANVPHTGGVSIIGASITGFNLTINNTIADPNGLGAFSYIWYADNIAIPGATNANYITTMGDTGKAIKVQVSYTDGGGHLETAVSVPTNPIVHAPIAPTGNVILIGDTVLGSELTADTSTIGDGNGLGTLHYQWKADGVNILGSSNIQSYTSTEADLGKVISVVVAWIDDDGYSESLTATADDIIKVVNIAPTGSVSITGNLIVGSTLTADTSLLADGSGLGIFHYQWKADGVNIAGATHATYLLLQAQASKTITVEVTYKDQAGWNESMVGTAAGLVNAHPLGTATITGNLINGQVITANTSAVTDGNILGTLHYTWKADDIVIAGADDSATYTLTSAEIGKIMSVDISYVDGDSFAESLSATALIVVKPINVLPTGTLQITGNLITGETLTIDTTNLVDANGLGTLQYQWKADTVNITNATNTTLVLTSAELNKTISVAVTYTDTAGYNELVLVTATGPVLTPNNSPTGTVVITGDLFVGATLTAGTTALADVDGLGAFSYQWKADDIVINGATNATYVLTFDEVNKTMSVAVSYTDGTGHNELMVGTDSALVQA